MRRPLAGEDGAAEAEVLFLDTVRILVWLIEQARACAREAAL